MARANARPAPVMMAGNRVGSVMVKKIRVPDAPRVDAAASAEKVMVSRTGCTERTVKGSVTNTMANVMPIHVPVSVKWIGDSGPYKV